MCCSVTYYLRNVYLKNKSHLFLEMCRVKSMYSLSDQPNLELNDIIVNGNREQILPVFPSKSSHLQSESANTSNLTSSTVHDTLEPTILDSMDDVIHVWILWWLFSWYSVIYVLNFLRHFKEFYNEK